MSAAQKIIASLNVAVSDKKLVALLDKHLAAADEVVKSGNLVDPVRLAVLAVGPGFLLQVKFIPGPEGRSDRGVDRWGGGAFQSEKKAPPPGLYRLVIEGEEAKVFEGELEVWSGSGQQTGVDGEWNIVFEHP